MNKSVKLIAVLVGVLVLLVVGKFVMAQQVDDQKLIAQALNEAVKASREGKPGGVVDKLSVNLKVNGADVGARNSEVFDLIRKGRPDVTFDNTKAVVSGEEATIVTPAHINIDLFGQNINRSVPEITLRFRKEKDVEWLFIPTTSWKLAEVTAPQSAVDAFTSGG